MRGFNVGVTISLGDMEMALDYLNDEKKFMPDVENYKKIRLEGMKKDTVKVEEPAGSPKEDKEVTVVRVTNEEEVTDDTGMGRYREEPNSTDDNDGDDMELDIDMSEYEDTAEDEDDEDDGGNVEETHEHLDIDSKDASTREEVNEDRKERMETREEMEMKMLKMQEELDRIKSNTVKGHVKTESDSQQQVKGAKVVALKAKRSVEMAPDIANKHMNNGGIERYNGLMIEELYAEVKEYMGKMGVGKTPVSKSQLESKFGQENIRKLLMKSYLITLGNRITTGR